MKARTADRGFTLLEVLAAVAIVGVLFTMLLTSSMQSLRKQGENHRRVYAGLIADRYLAEIETNLMSGVLPEPGEQEETEPFEALEFAVFVRILPFDAYAEDQVALPLAPGAVADLEEASDIIELLATDADDLSEMLSTIRIEVLWKEGVNELEVVRTTYALDVAGTLAAFPYERAASGSGDDDRGNDDRGDQPDEFGDSERGSRS